MTDAGHKFEELVTADSSADSEQPLEVWEHIQLLNIGGFNILTCAESDAVEENDTDPTGVSPVEIKLANPQDKADKKFLACY